MRTLAIGDIHGCSTALKTLIDYIQPNAEDVIVMLGDYIDRGPDSKGVIDYIIELKKTHNIVTLKGNHELMIEDARHDIEALYFWVINGGDAAADSFGVDELEDIPDLYWEFIESCQLYYETPTHILAHGGLDPDTPLEEQAIEDLCWRRLPETAQHISGKKLVCGHTPQRTGTPLVLDHLVCIDTHAFANKWLTCLDIDSGDYWQANEKGKTRKKSL